MNVGIIGFGGAAKVHLGVMRSVKGVKVEGAFDISEKAQDDIGKQRLKTYRSVDEMLRDRKVDTILVSSISSLHGKHSIECLRAGKNVIVEKPMAETLKEAEKMVSLARDKNLILTVFHNRRFDPDIEGARRFLDEGTIGNIVYLRNMLFPGEPGREAGWRRFKKLGGGVLLDWGSHLIDQTLTLIKDEVAEVIGDARYVPLFEEEQDADNHFIIFLKFKNRAMAEVGFSRLSCIPFPKLYIQGERGSIQAERWDRAKVVARFVVNGKIKTREIPDRDLTNYYSDKAKKFYQNFLEVAKGKSSLLVTPDSALRVMKVIDKALT